jgi:hypothetical protein
MNMHADNLARALIFAIEGQEHNERKLGYTMDSALLGGWKAVYGAIRRGERIEVLPSDTYYPPDAETVCGSLRKRSDSLNSE